MYKNPILEKVKYCRVCESKNVVLNIFKKQFFLSNLNQIIDINYGICIDCQYIFQSDYFGDDFLNYYYEHSPMLRKQAATVYEMDQLERQSEFLFKNLDFKKNLNFLEIGAHTGHFLLHLKNNMDCITYYEELSEEALKVLATYPKLLNYKLNLEVKIDVIILRHVLEHIHHLKLFIEYLDSILVTDGIIFIEVPDWGTLDDHTDTFIFEHLSQFNSNALTGLMNRHGYHRIALEKSINSNDPATPNRVMRFIFKKTNVPILGNKDFCNYFNSFRENRYDYANKKLNSIFNNIPHDKTIAFYPASNLSFSAVLETDISKFNFIGYFDSDSKKRGKDFIGYKVYDAKKLKDFKPDYIFIFTQAYEPEIRDLFKEMKLTSKIYSITEILSSEFKENKYK
jgi:hypothetical protein